MNPLRFTRRNLLRGSLAATAAFPLLEARRAEGQQGAPTRLVVFTTPNGTRNSLFWPTGSETSFQLPAKALNAPLQPYLSSHLAERAVVRLRHVGKPLLSIKHRADQRIAKGQVEVVRDQHDRTGSKCPSNPTGGVGQEKGVDPEPAEHSHREYCGGCIVTFV